MDPDETFEKQVAYLTSPHLLDEVLDRVHPSDGHHRVFLCFEPETFVWEVLAELQLVLPREYFTSIRPEELRVPGIFYSGEHESLDDSPRETNSLPYAAPQKLAQTKICTKEEIAFHKLEFTPLWLEMAPVSDNDATRLHRLQRELNNSSGGDCKSYDRCRIRLSYLNKPVPEALAGNVVGSLMAIDREYLRGNSTIVLPRDTTWIVAA